MEEWTGGRSMTQRMMGAARLQVATYEEVEADETATGQAALVVLVVAAAQAIGSAGAGLTGIVFGVLAAFLGWMVWAGVTYLVGDKLLGGTATWGELLRTLGFAQAPGVLYVFAAIPLLGALVRLVVVVWVLVAGIIAIRQALDFGTGKAVATAFIGWLALAVLAFLPGLGWVL